MPASSVDDGRGPLERLLALVEPPSERTTTPTGRLVVAHSDERPTWLTAGTWRIFAQPASAPVGGGRELVRFTLPEGQLVDACHDAARGLVQLPFDPNEAYVNYIAERWKSDSPRRGLTPAQLNAFYRAKRLLPRSVQIRARRLLIRRQGLPEFPAWPLDLSVARLLRFYAFCRLVARGVTEAEFRWFWPSTHRSALILTHDVETEDGLRRTVEVADLEEERGFRSSFNLGDWYPADEGIVRELVGRGFEIGLHGLRHDRSMFASRSSFEAQQPRLAEKAAELGAEGFRSPATHRVFDWLAELPVSYDCTIPHSDPFEPQPGGCSTLWPFFIDPIVELPYTMPQDYTLLTLLGRRSPELWIEQAGRIEQQFGLIQLISHPDAGYLGNPRHRSIYSEFLDAMAERDNLWRPLPRELASWWRRRDRVATAEGVGHGVVRIGGSPDEVELEPPRTAVAAPPRAET